jgi:uroporphyrinogen III methyltransferase/synthase
VSAAPLAGCRVLVTRPAHQAEPFRRVLAELGADVVCIPTIEIRPLRRGSSVAAAVRRLPATDLVIFTSANAVELFLQAGGEMDVGRKLAGPRVAAIGPGTASALEGRKIAVAVVAEEHTAEGVAAALAGTNLEGARVLLPRAAVARDTLPTLLRARGAQVQVLPLYETQLPGASAARLRELLSGDGVDVVTFTSSSTVRNFVTALGDALPTALLRTRVACIGPITAATAREAGMRVDIIARDYTTRGLATAIADAMVHAGDSR